MYLSLGGVQKALNTARLYQGGSVANPEGTSQPFQVQQALQAAGFNYQQPVEIRLTVWLSCLWQRLTIQLKVDVSIAC